MADQLLNIVLLGYPQVAVDAVVVDKFVTKRAEALFYYLVVTRRPHSRDKLAALFWPNMTETKSKKNLRTALPVLRKIVGDYLTINRDSIAFNGKRPFIVDTELLETAVSTGDVAELETAVSAYKDDFLEGFHVDGTPEFENWMLSKSEQYRNLFIQGLHQLTTHYLQQRQYTKGLAITARLLTVEPWSEICYRQRMLLFAYNKQRSSALKTYAECQQVLEETFGIAPMTETTILYKRIRAEETDGNETVLPLHNLPHEILSFIGRDAELEQVRAKVLDARYPLVTIMGEGGIGKSHFARMAASQLLYEFPDGVWYIPLIDIAPADEAEEVETALALVVGKALEIPMHTNTPLGGQIIAFLQGKKLLLVLDNIEHLINGIDFIVHLLKQAKSVQLIVTSRHRLNLQTESILRLRGLPAPAEGAMEDEAITYTSVQLFVERASQAEPDFVLTAQNVNAVGKICRLVGGLPLGIELAAALVESQQCDELASQIERDMGTLATAMRDRPAHHHTIYALFEYSWCLLSAPVQEMLAQCAVFTGGFRLEAATAVIGITESELTALVHQSLLTQGENGRYQFHPLLYQFSKEKLEGMGDGVQTAVSTRYYTYYLEWWQARKDRLISLPQSTLQQELSNSMQAWSFATEADDFIFLATVIEGWVIYMRQFPPPNDWLHTMTYTIERFNQQGSSVARSNEVYAFLLVGYIYALHSVEQHHEMSVVTDGLLSLASTPLLKSYAHYLKGMLLRNLYGDVDKAVGHLQEALKYADLLPTPMRVENLVELSMMLVRQGNNDEAIKQYEKALAIARSENVPRMTNYLLLNLGIFYSDQRNYCQALATYEEAYASLPAKTAAWKWNLIVLLERWAEVYVELGQYDKVEPYLERAKLLWEGWMPPRKYAISLNSHAKLYVRMQQYEKGVQLVETAVNLFQELGQTQWLAFAWYISGRIQLGLQRLPLATELFAMSLTAWGKSAVLEGESGPLTGLTAIALAQGDMEDVKKWGGQLAEKLSQISILHNAVEDWAWSYLVCHRALTAVNDPHEAEIIQTAYVLLQEQAAMMEETAVRQQFLAIPTHHEIIALAIGHKSS